SKGGTTTTIWLSLSGDGACHAEVEGVALDLTILRDTGEDVVLAIGGDGGAPLQCGYLCDAQGVTLWHGADRYDFAPVDPLARATDGITSDAILAPMPGQVRKLTAQAGQEVAEGDVLAVLEAMKMEHGLSAPRPGRVAQVQVAQGDQVAAGDVLITLEPQAEDAKDG
ncbi:MAG: biotin/lipoyl-containing protein, partial [Pseudomonadota bacterium]